MKNSKYIKVSVSERLPEKDGMFIVKRKADIYNLSYYFSITDEFSENDIEYWLE